MSDKQDQKKKDGERKDKKTHAMHAHEQQGQLQPRAHNPAAEVEEVPLNHPAHQRGTQNKDINRQLHREVDIHSDDTNQRHTHVPKSEQFEHDLKHEHSKSS